MSAAMHVKMLYVTETGHCMENQPKCHTWPIPFYCMAHADSYTHTLPVHCCINRLADWSAFHRDGFADHVKL